MTDSLSTLRHLIESNEDGTPCQPSEIYRSSNGDVWELTREKASDPYMVRHTPAPASGGQPSMMSIEQFLAANAHGPEHAALRILLGPSD